MRATRALLASLGASTCLVLAGTLALAAMSTVVAFQGWPGIEVPAGGAMTPTVVADVDAKAAPARIRPIVMATPRRPARSAAGVPRRTAAAPRPQLAATARRVTAATRSTPPAGSGRAPSASSGGKAVRVPTVVKVPQAGQPVRQVASGLSDGVQQAGQNLGGTVSRISPALGNTVSGTTQAVGQTLQGVGQTVGQVVDALTAPKGK